MPQTNEATLALADRLRALGEPELVELLKARSVSPGGIRDYFDLADALLAPESLTSALERLPRPTLIALATVAELGTTTARDAAAHLTSRGGDAAGFQAHLATASQLAVVIERGQQLLAPESLATALASTPGLRLAELLATPAPAAPTGSVRRADAEAAVQAFETAAHVAELTAELMREPARELARGGLALPDSKRLAASTGLDPDQVPALLAIAGGADLVASVEGERVATAAGEDWLQSGFAERWGTLAAAWRSELGEDLRGILSDRNSDWGLGLAEQLAWWYPADVGWIREHLEARLRRARLLGLCRDGVPGTAGVLLLAEGVAAAVEAMGKLFPAAVDQAYLQHDLSVVSPGPLEPALDARLRVMAVAEGGVLAPTYRITEASMYRAIASGETADTIRAFLGRLSLSGIPQPLEYLIGDIGARYGLVRVAPLPGGGSVVRSSDESVLRTIAVDAALAPLQFAGNGGQLTTGFDPQVVTWRLADARYPVAAEDSHGRTVGMRRPGQRPVTDEKPDPLVAFAARLRAESPADDAAADRAWLARQLDAAVRARLGLSVTVTMPDGSSAVYQLEPASVAGGRLRARDRRTDLERTLPLASITAVAPAEN